VLFGTESIAEVIGLANDLTRISPDRATAVIAFDRDLVLTTGTGCQSLPLAVALVSAARHTVMAWVSVKRETAYRATMPILATPPVAVVLAFVLMALDKARMPLTSIFGNLDRLSAAAGTKLRAICHFGSPFGFC